MHEVAIILEKWTYEDFKEWLDSGDVVDRYKAHIFFKNNGYPNLFIWSL